MTTKRGSTLVELLVTISLLSILSLLIVRILVPALTAWSRAHERAEINQSTLLCANWIGNDVLRSGEDTIELPDDKTVVMRCTMGPNGGDDVEFTELVVYRLVGSDLYRFSKSSPAPDGEDPFASGEFDSERQVASGVELFEVETSSPWQLDLHLRLKSRERTGELITSFYSIYKPIDPNFRDRRESQDEPDGSPRVAPRI